MTTTPLCLPLLSFSVQAANNKLITEKNPRGFVPQLETAHVLDWVMGPDGCVPTRRLAELAPGCGWVADRVLGLVNGGYDIGPYAGEDGRRCDKVWPRSLFDIDGRLAAMEALSGPLGLRPAVFVGSPMQITAADKFNALNAKHDMFSQAATAAWLASIGCIVIFDTGGCVGPSDARDTFEELNQHGVPFYLEPTRPRASESYATVRLATGLVSSTERMRTMEQETKAGTRAWWDTAFLERLHQHDVEWCTGISIQYAMERARLRLTAGRRVIMPLRLCTDDHVKHLQEWAAKGLDVAQATRAGATNVSAAVNPEFKVGGKA